MITYIYGTMNSGKTAQVVMLSHSLISQGKKVKVYKVNPNKTDISDSILSSRTGVSCECSLIGPNYDFSKQIIVNHKDIDVIIVDECQFLSINQVEYLSYLGKEVVFVGLKVNYLGEIFEASQRIMSYEPNLVHLPSYCQSPGCLNQATHHLLEVNGQIVKFGNDKVVGDIKGDKIKYSTVCKKHYIFTVTSREEGNKL